MRQRFFLIFNSTAGTSRSRAVADVVRALEAGGATIDRSTATSAETARAEAAVAARSGRYDALIACGGDGTIRQAAAAAAGTDCPVGAVMLGTGNVLAHELGLPRKAAAIAAMLMHGPVAEIKMGLANGDPFLLMAGVGFDGRVISHLDQRLKQRIAKGAFVPATFKALAAPLDQLKIQIDGRAIPDAAWVIVTNASRYGGAFVLSRQTNMRQTGLVAYVFSAASKIGVLRHATNIGLGRLDALGGRAGSGVRIVPCQTVQIESAAAAAVPVQIDGDDFGATPLSISADGGIVRLIVPSGS